MPELLRHGTTSLRLRPAAPEDLPLLAALNQELIRDEGSRNPMDLPGLEHRMRVWLEADYDAILFEVDTEVVGYALFRPEWGGIHLRQFLVRTGRRRRGLGLEAMRLLRSRIWPAGARVTLEVLRTNPGGLAFWKAVGFREYAVTLEAQGSEPRHAGGRE